MQLGLNDVQMCMSKDEESRSLFGFKWMKMGVKFAASVYMGRIF